MKNNREISKKKFFFCLDRRVREDISGFVRSKVDQRICACVQENIYKVNREKLNKVLWLWNEKNDSFLILLKKISFYSLLSFSNFEDRSDRETSLPFYRFPIPCPENQRSIPSAEKRNDQINCRFRRQGHFSDSSERRGYDADNECESFRQIQGFRFAHELLRLTSLAIL